MKEGRHSCEICFPLRFHIKDMVQGGRKEAQQKK